MFEALKKMNNNKKLVSACDSGSSLLTGLLRRKEPVLQPGCRCSGPRRHEHEKTARERGGAAATTPWLCGRLARRSVRASIGQCARLHRAGRYVSRSRLMEAAAVLHAVEGLPATKTRRRRHKPQRASHAVIS